MLKSSKVNHYFSDSVFSEQGKKNSPSELKHQTGDPITHRETCHEDPFSQISLLSVEVIKEEIDSSFYKKLNISIVLNDLNDDMRRMVRFATSKFSVNLYDDWEKFWNKQKKSPSYNEHGQPIEELIVINEAAMGKVLREVRLNPSLRVILLVKDMESFSIKEEYSFMMITDRPREVELFLERNKKRLILTSRR